MANPNQFNITLEPELKARLAELAHEFKFGKATKVGALIIETYIEHWALLQGQIRQWKEEQEREMMLSVEAQIRGERPPLVKGKAKAAQLGRKNQK